MTEKFFFKDRFFWILFLVLFSSGFVLFKSPFEFYFHYFIFILLIPFLLFKYGIPKFLIQILGVPLLIGLTHLSFENNNLFSFIKILGGAGFGVNQTGADPKPPSKLALLPLLE